MLPLFLQTEHETRRFIERRLPNPLNCETSLFSRTTQFTSKLISFSNFSLHWELRSGYKNFYLEILVVQRWHILLLNFSAYFFFFSGDCAVEPEVRGLRTPNWNQPELSIPAADQKDRRSGNENGRGWTARQVTPAVRLASHAGVFSGARASSLPKKACSTENNIPFSSLANHIVHSKFWKAGLDRWVTWITRSALDTGKALWPLIIFTLDSERQK